MHVAIIPDGNRRWARSRGLRPTAGHEKGADTLEELLEPAIKLGVTWLTFWGLSATNLRKRNRTETALLEEIIRNRFLKAKDHPKVHEHQVKIRVLGEWRSHFSTETQAAIQNAMESTKHYTHLSLTILLAYDGAEDMVRATQNITKEIEGGKRLTITPALIKEHLATRDLPNVDLLIRTGGEPHLSAGFLMWETQDSQLAFPSCFWPDFSPDILRNIVSEFNSRERRLGA